MTLHHRPIFLATLLCLLVPAISLAQEEITEEFTEQQLLEQQEQERIRQLWTERKTRTFNFWGDFVNNRNEVTEYKSLQKSRREKLSGKYLLCKQDIRRANRDTKYSTTTSCFRSVLTMDLETLRKQKQYYEQLIISDTRKTNVIEAIDALHDAIATIISAIDIGVYRQESQLVEAKLNLKELYREPKWLAEGFIRLEKLQTWMQHLMVRAYDVQRKESIPPKVHDALGKAIECLEQKEELLLQLEETNQYQALRKGIRQVQSELVFCIESIRDADILNKDLIQQAEDAQWE